MNDFVSVLYRRLYFDFRRPTGWTEKEFEKYIKEVIERTLKDSPIKDKND